MRSFISAASGLLVSSLVLTPALMAQSVAMREQIAQDKKTVADHLESANKACGSHVTLTTDYSTFADLKTNPDNVNDQSAWAYIVNATDAMDAVCRSGPEGKAAIASKLKSISVFHAPTETMTFSNGVLRYGVSYHNGGYSKLQKYLMDTL